MYENTVRKKKTEGTHEVGRSEGTDENRFWGEKSKTGEGMLVVDLCIGPKWSQATHKHNYILEYQSYNV